MLLMFCFFGHSFCKPQGKPFVILCPFHCLHLFVDYQVETPRHVWGSARDGDMTLTVRFRLMVLYQPATICKPLTIINRL